MADIVKELAGIEMPEYSEDEKFKLEVGITYKGSFKLKQDGQITVRPYKQGTKPGQLKKVVDGDQHAIFESRNLLRIVFTIPKTNMEQVRKRFKEEFFECYKDLCELEL
ncbi:MAG: hypothetical protein Q4C05_09245 [Akkermansia sp.]|nr:hypothetical protein [Akkermansia sp.]